MKLFPKTLITGAATVTAGLTAAATLFDENAYALLYTGMAGLTGAGLASAWSSFTEKSHAKILRNEAIAAMACMSFSTAIIETHPHPEHLHTRNAKTVHVDAAPSPIYNISAPRYGM